MRSLWLLCAAALTFTACTGPPPVAPVPSGPNVCSTHCAEPYPVSLWVALDSSGSMGPIARWQVNRFVQELVRLLQAPNDISSSGALGEAGGIAFCDVDFLPLDLTSTLASLDVWVQLTPDPTVLTNQTLAWAVAPSACVNGSGRTHLYDAIYYGGWALQGGFQGLPGGSPGMLRLFVVLTDGADTGSTIPLTAAHEHLGGLTTELILVSSGLGDPSALQTIATNAAAFVDPSFGQDYVRVWDANWGALGQIAEDIVARTCANWQPVANFAVLPDAELVLGVPNDGWSLTFDGSGSCDEESSAAQLTYEWTLDGPDGQHRTHSAQGTPTWSPTFTDADISYPDLGEQWTASLTVSDGSATAVTSQAFQVRGDDPDFQVNAWTAQTDIDQAARLTSVVVGLGESFTLTPSTTVDVDGGILDFSWEVLQAPVGAPIEPGQPNLADAEASWLFLAGPGSMSTLAQDFTGPGPSSTDTWRIEVCGEDDEIEDALPDACWDVEVEVLNVPPSIGASFDADIPGDGVIVIDASSSVDPDGGSEALHYNWSVVQGAAPPPEVVNLVDSQLEGTGPAYAQFDWTPQAPGTWIIELALSDDEGETVTEEFVVLVHGPAHAELQLDGPVVPSSPAPAAQGPLMPYSLANAVQGPGFVLLGPGTPALMLDARASWDADSDCPLDPSADCHVNSRTGVHDVSEGIGSGGFHWSVISAPADRLDPASLDPVFLGPLDLAFPNHSPITADQPTASIRLDTSGTPLSPGAWEFEVDVEDAEGEQDARAVGLSVAIADSAPVAVLTVLEPGGRFDVSLDGETESIIGVSALGSYDPDNPPGDPLPRGILQFDWALLSAPAGCSATPVGAGALWTPWPGSPGNPLTVPIECQGQWTVTVRAEDDELVWSGWQQASFIIGDCPAGICIADLEPAAPIPFVVDDLASHGVPYRIDSGTYDQLASSALSVEFSVFEAGSPRGPVVYAALLDDVPTSAKGQTLLATWNGTAGVSGPVGEGIYGVGVTLQGASSVFPQPPEAAHEARLQVLRGQITRLGSSEDVGFVPDLASGQANMNQHIAVAGSAPLGGLRAEVRAPSGAVVLTENVATPTPSTWPWSGALDSLTGPVAAPYELRLSLLSPAPVLAQAAVLSATPWTPVLLFDLELEPLAGTIAGTDAEVFALLNDNDSDEDGVADLAQASGGVPGEEDLRELRVTLRPAGVEGSVELVSFLLAPSPGSVAFWADAEKQAPLGSIALAAGPAPATASAFVEGTLGGTAEVVAQVVLPGWGAAWGETAPTSVHVSGFDLDVDADMNGTIDVADEAVEAQAGGLVVNVNIDHYVASPRDYDCRDAEIEANDDYTNDMARLVLRGIDYAPPGGTVELSISSTNSVRVFDFAQAPVLGKSGDPGFPATSVHGVDLGVLSSVAELEYRIEACYLGNVEMTAELKDMQGAVLASDVVTVAANLDWTPGAPEEAARHYVRAWEDAIPTPPPGTGPYTGAKATITVQDVALSWAPAWNDPSAPRSSRRRQLAQSAAWVGVVDSDGVPVETWVQAGFLKELDRDEPLGAELRFVYLEVYKPTMNPPRTLVPLGPWDPYEISPGVFEAEFRVEVHPLAAEAEVFINGTSIFTFSDPALLNQHYDEIQLAAEIDHSIDQRVGRASSPAVFAGAEVLDTGQWRPAQLGAAEIYSYDALDLEPLSSSTSPQWTVGATTPQGFTCWDAVREVEP